MIQSLLAAFVSLLVVVRVLIAWLYTRTDSLLLAQLIHASSTGSLVVLGAPAVSPAKEAGWYLAYGGLLAAVTIVVVTRSRVVQLAPA